MIRRPFLACAALAVTAMIAAPFHAGAESVGTTLTESPEAPAKNESMAARPDADGDKSASKAEPARTESAKTEPALPEPAEAGEPAGDEKSDAAETPGQSAEPEATTAPDAKKAAPQGELSPTAQALRKALASLPAATSDEERNEYAALLSFYENRAYALLWTTEQGGYTEKAVAVAAEIGRAKAWGLDPRDFTLPAGLGLGRDGSSWPSDMAEAEIKISLAVLKYGRFARGGRIINPSEQLSSYLDRRPQFLKPAAILEGIASADQPGDYLTGLHPKHPQFELLRQKYLALSAHGKQSAEGKRLLANMEEWRWMPDDLGEVYIWNNIPDFTQRVVKGDTLLRKAAIVTGQIGKQTPIFSRPLRKITFKPTWIVPDSIKVRELLPNLITGGGSLMREWDLEVLKDGEPVNWRKINWANTDIRNYAVIQQHGPKSVMGKVKFSFPSQHTVFMHDTADGERWMLQAPKRTYSHGCMRVANPIGLAEIVLDEDKGWDSAKVKESFNHGGNNNEIPIDHRIMVHMTYFTALVDDDGKLRTFPDVYGHERRITLALEGKWNQIEKGRDHLAPVELTEAHMRPKRKATPNNFASAPPPSVMHQRVYAAPHSVNPYPAPAAPVYSYAPPPPPPPQAYNYRSGFLESLFGGHSQQYGTPQR